MAKLTRIYTSGIGAGVARFSPLTIDFRNGDQCGEDSIIWLRNGGGKTCWLALVYSIFRPRSINFLLRKAKGKDSSITDFIQGNDLAFVITEWHDSEQIAFLPDRKALRVVGQIFAWKNGQKSEDRGKLKHALFSFRCNEKLNLDTLPVMGISPNPVKSYEDFLDWLTNIQSRYPNLEITFPNNLDEWDDHLIRIGLDPALFQFQILMNQREGDIDQYFKDYCSSPQKFANEFLKMALEPTKADSVSSNIVALRNKLRLRDPLLREQSFIGSFLSTLEPFLQEVGIYNGNQKALEAARRQARGVQAALAGSIECLKKDQQKEEGLFKDAQIRAETAAQAVALLNQNINYIRLCHARLEVEAATARENEAKVSESAANDHLKSCEAAGKLSELHELQSQERAIQDALDQQSKKERPVLEELRRRGSIFRELLRLQMEQLNQSLAAIAQKRANLQLAASNLASRQLALNKQIGSAEKDQQHLQMKVSQREAAYRTLLNNGILEEGETAQAARERCEAAASAVQQEIERLKGVIEEKETEYEQTKEAIANQRVEQTGLQRKREDHETFLADLEKRQIYLEKDKFILDLTGGKLPDLELPRLMEGLKTRVMHVQQIVLQAAVDSAEDQRALKHLEQAGVLPPSLDVERAVEQLKNEGIPAFSALDYLAQNVHDPEEALKLLLSDPGKFAGIIISRPEQLDKVRALLTARSNLKGPVQVSPLSLEPWPGEPDRVILPPATSGSFNRSTAQDDRAHIQTRVNKYKATQDSHSQEIEEVKGTIRALSEYLERYAPNREQTKMDLEGVRNLEGILRAAISANQEKAQDIQQTIHRLKQQIEQQEANAEDHKEKTRNLTAFIRNHDTEYDANKRQVADLGESIATLTNYYNGVSVEIEQTQQEQRAQEAQETQYRLDHRGVETEHGKVQHYEDRPTRVGEIDLPQARANYETQLDIYNRISNTELHGRLKAKREEISRKEQEYKRLSAGLHAVKIEALARRTTLPTETETAKQDHNRRYAEHAVAQSELARLRGDHTRVDKDTRGKTTKPEDIPDPTTPAEAMDIKATLETQIRIKTSEQKAAETEAVHHKRNHDDCFQSFKSRRELLEDLEELDIGEGEVGTLTLPTEDQQLRKFVKDVQHGLKTSGQSVSQSRGRLDERFAAIHDLLTKPDEPGAENVMKTKLGALSQEALIQGAAEIRNSANTRRTIIQKDLEAIEQDRQGILTEVDIVYSQAKHLLNSAERISRIPDSIKAWANQPFLRIKLREVAPADTKLRLQELLDAILLDSETPSGLDLAYRSIVQVSGQDGIDITILKPDVILRADRIPVERIQQFSGGEGVTTAILLYCTLLQLRSQTYGRVTHSKDAGALILDNPIGKCSRPDLLKMHLEISKKMRVQLIYLTGVNDVNAIGTFDRIIRLKNQHKDIRTGDLHITVDGSQFQKAEIQMRNASA